MALGLLPCGMAPRIYGLQLMAGCSTCLFPAPRNFTARGGRVLFAVL